MAADVVVNHQAAPYGLEILRGLQSAAHIYQGTVDPVVVAARRARNRRARAARRVHRLRAA